MAHSKITYEQILPMTAAQLATLVSDDSLAFLNVENVFTKNQKIATSTNPKLTLDENNSGTSYGYVEDTSANLFSIKKISASGVALIDIDPSPNDGVSNSSFRFWRSTVTSGSYAVTFHQGTATVQGQISASLLANTYFALDHRFGIGTNSPAGKLTVKQESTIAAIPTIELEQTDLSEEFINFRSTVGAGNPIDTAALGTYYGKVRVQVEGVGYKYMPLYNT